MIHVLSIIHYPVYGGPHNRNVRLAPALAGMGVRTTVLLPDEPGNAHQRMQVAGMSVEALPLRRLRATRSLSTHMQFLTGFPGQIRSLRELIRRLQIDVVQLNGLVNPHGAIAAHALGVPVVWQVLDTYTPVALRKVLAPLVRRYADVVMCTGEQVARVHPGVTRHPDRLVNFYPPVDVEQFDRDPALRAAMRARLGVAPDELVVGTLGNVNPQKGHDNFIRAAAQLRRRVPNARFLLLGVTHKNHHAYIEGLWKLAAQSGLELGRDLIHADPSGKVHEYLQALDVFWMTPRPNSEGIPTAMEEAMATCLPVVSFDVGSIGELVAQGRSGFLVSDQDSGKVAACTADTLLDAAARAKMGQAGREFILANASIERCAQTHLDAYERAIRFHAARGVRRAPRAA